MTKKKMALAQSTGDPAFNMAVDEALLDRSDWKTSAPFLQLD